MSENGQNVPAGSLDSEPFAAMPGRNGKSSTGALPSSPLYLKFATGPLNIPVYKTIHRLVAPPISQPPTFVMTTGVIGQNLPIEKITTAIDHLEADSWTGRRRSKRS